MRKKMLIGILSVPAFSLSGCGIVHGTDGRTTTIVGFGRTTEGQTQTEAGAGKGMDSNMSRPRSNTFDDRSNAVRRAYGD